MNRKLSTIAAIMLGLLASIASVQTHSAGIESLRGATELDQEADAPENKKYAKDGQPIARAYIQQPPLVPHKIDRYRINLKANKCLTCHSWDNYLESGATKISQTHFEDRDANVLANISARRYFCTQCHVPQVDAEPLVDNEFKPVSEISNK